MPEAVVTLTPMQLQQIMTSAIEAARKPNPLEERQIKEAIEREERRTKLMLALGKAEEESLRRKRSNCTHCRWPAGNRLAGHSAPKGQGEWATGGQAYQDGTAAVICLRCSTVWRFKPSAEEYNMIIQNGLLGCPVPAPEQVIEAD